MKIYVVMGRAGAYSDMEEWPVAAYTIAKRAQNRLDLAQKSANRIVQKIKDRKLSTCCEETLDLLKGNEFDPNM